MCATKFTEFAGDPDMTTEADTIGRSKLRALLLLHDLSLTGAPKLALDIFECLKDQVSVEIVALAGGELEPWARRLGPVSLCSHEGSRIRRGMRRLRRMALNRARPRRWDLIYVNTGYALPALRDIRLGRFPVLMHVHERESFLESHLRSWPELLTQVPDRYIAVSRSVQKDLVRVGGIPEERIDVVYPFARLGPTGNGSAGSLTRPSANVGRASRAFVIGGAGTPSWWKGIELWLLAAADLRKLLPDFDFRFKWVGVQDNLIAWQCRAMARKLKVDDIVEFLPRTAQPSLVYAQFDAFALTSWEDACPLVVLENMMLGTPVICFGGSGGAGEVIADAGVVIDEFSPRVMAEKLASLMRDPERLAFLGRAAALRVREHFTPEAQTAKLLAIMRCAISLKRSQTPNERRCSGVQRSTAH